MIGLNSNLKSFKLGGNNRLRSCVSFSPERFGKNVKTQTPLSNGLDSLLQTVYRVVGTPRRKALVSMLTGLAGGVALAIPPVGIGLLMLSASMMLWAIQDYFCSGSFLNSPGQNLFIQNVVGRDTHQVLMGLSDVNQHEIVGSFTQQYKTFWLGLSGDAYQYRDLSSKARNELIQLVETAFKTQEPTIEAIGRKIVMACFDPAYSLKQIISNREQQNNPDLVDSALKGTELRSGQMRERHRIRRKPLFFRDVTIEMNSGSTQNVSIYASPDGEDVNFKLTAQDTQIGTLKVYGAKQSSENIVSEYKIHENLSSRASLLKHFVSLAMLTLEVRGSVKSLEFIIDKEDEPFFKSLGFVKVSSEEKFITPHMVLAVVSAKK